MAWFDFLRSQGFFKPENNPGPTLQKDGWQIPNWEVLGYLEKLSVEISKGKNLELIEDVLTVIKEVSEHPKDNPKTWYVIIKILSSIPNDRISHSYLEYTSIWLSSKFDSMLQTSEVCNNLLNKFLCEQPTNDDIIKARIILKHLFLIKQNSSKNLKGVSYTLNSNTYILTKKIEEEQFIRNVVAICSNDFVYQIGDTTKYLLLDYPNGINLALKSNELDYSVCIKVDKTNLIFDLREIQSETDLETMYILNWEDKDDRILKEEILSIFNAKGICYEPKNDFDDLFYRLFHLLNIDLSGSKRIRDLDETCKRNGDLVYPFALFFRNLLLEISIQDPNRIKHLLRSFCFEVKYNRPFFKRITLYIICENWDTSKSIFWDLISSNDPYKIFSNYRYQKELFDLLKKNQSKLLKNEIDILGKIIEGDDKTLDKDSITENTYKQLCWYSALKDTPPFKQKYDILSKKLNINSEYFETLNEVKIRSGSVSPISKDELLSKSTDQIVEYLKNFNPKNRFEEPNVSGLSEILCLALESEPQRITSEIDKFIDIPYIYSYKLLYSLGDLWNKGVNFNWEKILQYCLAMLKNPKFYNDELKIDNDDLKADSKWVIGAIASLLSNGLRTDTNAFDIELLPLANEILQSLVNNLKSDTKEIVLIEDYPTYCANSTSGKVLKAHIDYSLRQARYFYKFEDPDKWEPEMKSLFEQTFNKGIIEGFIIEGMYFEQLCFLDYDWITKKVKHYYELDNEKWLAFMGGFTFSRPPYSEELYRIFIPHYERLITNKIDFKTIGENRLVYHLTAFYFWQFETLSNNGLLFKFIINASSSDIGDLISYIGQQHSYVHSLRDNDLLDFNQRIFDLWKFLTDKYESTNDEEEQKNLALLSNWIAFVAELDNNYTDLILKSTPYIDIIYTTEELLNNLQILMFKGSPTLSAKYIGRILLTLKFKEYLSNFSKELLKELVAFLFKHGQKKIASDFCNKMGGVYQQFFLRDVYEANNE